MIEKPIQSGLYFRLETNDFHGDWRGFISAIKKLRSIIDKPPELDVENLDGWWYPGKWDVPAMRLFYEQFIAKPLRDRDADLTAGFAPTKKRNYFPH